MSRLVETVSFRSALACRVVSKERRCRRGQAKINPERSFAPSGRRRLSLLAFLLVGNDGFAAGEACSTCLRTLVGRGEGNNTWSIGPVLKMMAELEDSVKSTP